MKTTEKPSIDDVVAQLYTPEPRVGTPRVVRDAVISAKRAAKFVEFMQKHHVAPANLSTNHADPQIRGWVVEHPTPEALGSVMLVSGHTFPCALRDGQAVVSGIEPIRHPYASDEAVHVLAAAAIMVLSQESTQPQIQTAHQIPAPRQVAAWEPGLHFVPY